MTNVLESNTVVTIAPEWNLSLRMQVTFTLQFGLLYPCQRQGRYECSHVNYRSGNCMAKTEANPPKLIYTELPKMKPPYCYKKKISDSWGQLSVVENFLKLNFLQFLGQINLFLRGLQSHHDPTTGQH